MLRGYIANVTRFGNGRSSFVVFVPTCRPTLLENGGPVRAKTTFGAYPHCLSRLLKTEQRIFHSNKTVINRLPGRMYYRCLQAIGISLMETLSIAIVIFRD